MVSLGSWAACRMVAERLPPLLLAQAPFEHSSKKADMSSFTVLLRSCPASVLFLVGQSLSGCPEKDVNPTSRGEASRRICSHFSHCHRP